MRYYQTDTYQEHHDEGIILEHSRSRSENKIADGSMLNIQPSSVLDEIKQEISEYSKKSKEKVIKASKKHRKNSKPSKKASNTSAVIESQEQQIDTIEKQQWEFIIDDKNAIKSPGIVNIQIENTHQP